MQKIFFLLLFIATTSGASSIFEVDAAQRLLHMKNGRSLIVNDDFFIAGKVGQTNAEAEWRATIDAIQQQLTTPASDVNGDLRCLYPARWLWLQANALFTEVDFDVAKCSEFSQWAHLAELESVSLIYATGYLGNPASYYGHMLLKLDYQSTKQVYDLLDTSINYGAAVPENENGLIYIVKGITGGYEAQYTDQRFFHHQHNYGENELRDIWQYPLALSPEKRLLMLAHLWELKRTKFDYYFAKENCAYQIAKVMELVYERPLFNESLPWLMPQSIVERLVQYDTNAKTPTLIPSRQSTFYAKYAGLTSTQKELVRTLIEKPNGVKAILSPLNDDEANKLLEVLLDYWQLVELDSKESQYDKKKQVLLARLSRKHGLTQWDIPEKQAPHLAQPGAMLRIGLGYEQDKSVSGHFRFRPAYYDRLSPDVARPPYSSLSMFDLSLAWQQERVRLADFRVVNIESHAFYTGLPNEPGNTWKINFGIRQSLDDCYYCFRVDGEAGLGLSKKITTNWMSFLMASLALEAPSERYLWSTLQLGSVFDLHSDWRQEVLVDFDWAFQTGWQPRIRYQWNHRYSVSQEHDIRFSVEFQDDWAATLNSSWYF